MSPKEPLPILRPRRYLPPTRSSMCTCSACARVRCSRCANDPQLLCRPLHPWLPSGPGAAAAAGSLCGSEGCWRMLACLGWALEGSRGACSRQRCCKGAVGFAAQPVCVFQRGGFKIEQNRRTSPYSPPAATGPAAATMDAARTHFRDPVPVHLVAAPATGDKPALVGTRALLAYVGSQQSAAGQPELVVRLTDEQDPFFLYSLVISEDDFTSLRRSQDIKVDFKTFPENLVALLRLCIEESGKDQPRYLVELERSTVHDNQAVVDSAAPCGVLRLVETNTFKNLTHLSLQLIPGSDATVKAYLAQCLGDLKRANRALEAQLHEKSTDSSATIQQLREALNAANNRLEHVEREATAQGERLHAENVAAMSKLQEDHFAERTKLQNELLRLRESLESDKSSALEHSSRHISSLTEELAQLKSQCRSFEDNVRSLTVREDLARANCESLRAEVESLKQQRAELDTQRREAEKAANQATVQAATLTAELRSKTEACDRQLECDRQAQARIVQLESELSQTRLRLAALEQTQQAGARDVDKANSIISKLQGEVIGLKAKFQTKNEIILQQEKVVSQLEKRCKALQQETARLSESVQSAQAEKAAAEKQLQLNEAELEALQQQLKDKDNVNSWLQKQLNQQTLSRSRVTSSGLQRAGSVASDLGSERRIPFGQAASSEFNRHVAFKKSMKGSGVSVDYQPLDTKYISPAGNSPSTSSSVSKLPVPSGAAARGLADKPSSKSLEKDSTSTTSAPSAFSRTAYGLISA
eukprot:m.132205 g.132205  ORF g.132205 m.132205 type:complete len:761 (+) comp9829_c0_seq2:1425-3707(+)